MKKRFNKGNIDIDLLASLINGKIKELGISQSQAGDRMNVPKETLNRVIRLRTNLTFRNLIKVCRWLEIPVDLIFSDSKARQSIRSDGNSMIAIRGLIKKDPSLTELAKEGLIELMDCAYRRFVQQQ